MLIRLPDWDVRLMRFVDRTRNAPFEWSRQDCATWALRAIDAMCGTAHANVIAGQYADHDGSIAYGMSRGWTTTADAAMEYCGPPLHRVSRAQRGDVLHAPSEAHPMGTLMVYVGNRLLFGPGAAYLETIPFRVALAGTMTAFPVGAR